MHLEWPNPTCDRPGFLVAFWGAHLKNVEKEILNASHLKVLEARFSREGWLSEE